MEIYNTEEEQLDALKRWWRENGTSVVTGLALGIVAVVGWNIWQQRAQGLAEQASGLYQQMSMAIEQKQYDAANQFSEQLVHDYARTPYGAFARLAQAKLKTDGGDLAAAQRILEGLIADGGDANFVQIARLRLCQVLLAQNQPDAALKQAEAAEKAGFGAYEGAFQALKGDVYVATGRAAEARAAYAAAQKAGANSALLAVKLDDLGATGQEPAH